MSSKLNIGDTINIKSKNAILNYLTLNGIDFNLTSGDVIFDTEDGTTRVKERMLNSNLTVVVAELDIIDSRYDYRGNDRFYYSDWMLE